MMCDLQMLQFLQSHVFCLFICYVRDDPKEMPMFVASNSASIDCLIKPRGENMFSAVRYSWRGLGGGGGGGEDWIEVYTVYVYEPSRTLCV